MMIGACSLGRRLSILAPKILSSVSLPLSPCLCLSASVSLPLSGLVALAQLQSALAQSALAQSQSALDLWYPLVSEVRLVCAVFLVLSSCAPVLM